MEQFTALLQRLDATSILVCMACISFAKNILPPLPSDALMVFAGTLAALGLVGVVPLVSVCALGSTAGFMVMFALGQRSGRGLQSRERIWIVPVRSVQRYVNAIETLFQRYGYGVIAANRFLGVKRVTVAFFAGWSGLSVWKTSFCALFSAAAWSATLLYGGYVLGEGWKHVLAYLSVYGSVMFVVVVAVLAWAFWKSMQSWNLSPNEPSHTPNSAEPV
jgi:membrane protein DedA with SNARE-associated domain